MTLGGETEISSHNQAWLNQGSAQGHHCVLSIPQHRLGRTGRLTEHWLDDCLKGAEWVRGLGDTMGENFMSGCLS